MSEQATKMRVEIMGEGRGRESEKDRGREKHGGRVRFF